MGRKKVRHFPSVEDWKKQLTEYLTENKEKYIAYMLKRLGYEDTETLWEEEYHGKFGFDCGWVQLHPKDKEMQREWRLDNGGIDDCIFDIASVVYNTQSTTIKEIIVEKLVEDLDLNDTFIIYTRLD